MIRIYTFEVAVEGYQRMRADAPKSTAMGSALETAYAGRVRLCDVVVYERDVTPSMRTSAPTRREEVEYALMHEFASKLKRVLDLHDDTHHHGAQ